NEAFVAHSGMLRAQEDWEFLLSTGRGQFRWVREQLTARWGPPDEERADEVRWGNVRVKPYVEDMAAVYAAAHLVVARAGAMSLAEITARGVPAVLVPYPYAAEGHQEENARELEAQGAALVVPDDACRQRLIPTVLTLAADEDGLRRMREANAAWGRPRAAQAVADLLEPWLGGR